MPPACPVEFHVISYKRPAPISPDCPAAAEGSGRAIGVRQQGRRPPLSSCQRHGPPDKPVAWHAASCGGTKLRTPGWDKLARGERRPTNCVASTFDRSNTSQNGMNSVLLLWERNLLRAGDVRDQGAQFSFTQLIQQSLRHERDLRSFAGFDLVGLQKQAITSASSRRMMPLITLPSVVWMIVIW